MNDMAGMIKRRSTGENRRVVGIGRKVLSDIQVIKEMIKE